MIISASIRTDIPAYFSDWFFNRLQTGCVLVKNPMNPRQVSRVSLSGELIDCFVFWSKNPAPMLEKLSQLQHYMYYFQYTLNPYGTETESNLPPLVKRIETFCRLSELTSKHRVVWRYDPILISSKYTASWHMEAFGQIAAKLKDYTDTCMISFLDLYGCNRTFLAKQNITAPDISTQNIIANGFSAIAKENNLRLSSCCESIDLAPYGIGHGSCIDKERIEKLLGCTLRIPSSSNKRQGCHCVTSIDIGTYHTCRNGCGYCYANHSPVLLEKSWEQYHEDSPVLCSAIECSDQITDRKMIRYYNGQISLNL